MSELNISPEVKMYIVIRKDLKMSRGKEDAQVAHAAMAFICHRLAVKSEFGLLRGNIALNEAEMRWLTGGLKTKIILEVENEIELFRVAEEAKAISLEAHLIKDMGLTEFKRIPTYTCLAIGPDFAERAAPVTQKLKLRK